MMITAPLYFSKCLPLAAMHFTALAFMSNIVLLTIAGSICATCLVMLACSSLRLAGRGLYTLDLRYPQRQKSRGERSGERGGHSLPLKHLLLITLSPNWLSRYLMLASVQWTGAPKEGFLF